MKKYDYMAVIWREDGGYVSKCPELNVASCGDTLEESVSNLKEAVELYLENARELDLLGDLEASLTTKDKFIASLELVI